MSMTEIQQVLLSEMLQWYRLQRHDYLNHWQVIMGHLQLNQPDEALAYMRETVAVSRNEQKIAQIPESQLAAILLGFLLCLQKEGVIASLDFSGEMVQGDFWQDHWREEYATGFYGYTKECLSELSAHAAENLSLIDAQIYLYDEPGGFSCQFILSDEEAVLSDKFVKFADQA